jgi:hypothetical protein
LRDWFAKPTLAIIAAIVVVLFLVLLVMAIMRVSFAAGKWGEFGWVESKPLFTGTVTLNGARYSWRASICTDVDGGRFVVDLGEFRPVDWHAKMRLVQ